jgi:hypothetical protein
MAELVLGPVLRYVDETQATLWMQTDEACEVEVLGHSVRTFQVEGSHFALVVVSGLEAGSRTPYEVALDGHTVWPPSDYEFPPGVIPARGGETGRLRLAFGSCREVSPHEPPYALPERAHPRAQGIDALRAYALELARGREEDRPDALLMLGDQLYADEPSRQLMTRLRRGQPRPDIDDHAVTFADYAGLYRESWREPAVRWLLSTVPSMMSLDDHEIVDAWQISEDWVRRRRGDEAFEQRLTSGLAAYWLFQHLGNLSPAELATDETFRRVRDARDGGDVLREIALRADRETAHVHWSFCRDLGRVRLLVLDSRAARRLVPGDRRIIDDPEWEWARERATSLSGVDHLLLGSSLPFLLPAGLHDLEAAVERVGDGAWGRGAARVAERARCGMNLGHWAGFQESFARLEELLEAARAGGDLASVVMLSGDVHHGYLARWRPRAGGPPVWQAVSSPFRKRLAGYERRAMRLGYTRAAAALGAALARAARARAPAGDWELAVRPSYDNQIGILEFEGRAARVRLVTPEGSDWRDPRLRIAWERTLA